MERPTNIREESPVTITDLDAAALEREFRTIERTLQGLLAEDDRPRSRDQVVEEASSLVGRFQNDVRLVLSSLDTYVDEHGALRLLKV